MGSAPTKTHIRNRNGEKKGSAFIKNEYSRDPGIVTSILQELEPQALQERRKTSRFIPVFDGPYKEAVLQLIASLSYPDESSWMVLSGRSSMFL
jgi:hypothetical protein